MSELLAEVPRPDFKGTEPTGTSIKARWVSLKEFPSGDIAVRVVAFDPDVVPLVKTIAKDRGGRYNPEYKTWNVPRWSAQMVRYQARQGQKSQHLLWICIFGSFSALRRRRFHNGDLSCICF